MESAEDYMVPLKKYNGVRGVMMFSGDGNILSTNLDLDTTMMYGYIVTQMCDKARTNLKDAGADKDVTRIRVRMRGREIIMVPDKNYIMVVVQSPDITSANPEYGNQPNE